MIAMGTKVNKNIGGKALKKERKREVLTTQKVYNQSKNVPSRHACHV